MQPLISTHFFQQMNELYCISQIKRLKKKTIQNGARGNTLTCRVIIFSASPKSEIFNFSKSREVKRRNRSAFYFPANKVNNSAVQEIICETHL